MFYCGQRLVAAGLLWGVLAGSVRAEKEPLSPEELRETATHVVVGKAAQIFARTEKVNNYEYTRYVAEIRVGKVEKGDGIKPGELMYVRYWRKRWLGPGNPPPDTSGHSGRPTAGQTLRIYAAKNAYDGFGTAKDGGYNVIGANGFEAATADAKE
jgi:hypothetical protein